MWSAVIANAKGFLFIWMKQKSVLAAMYVNHFRIFEHALIDRLADSLIVENARITFGKTTMPIGEQAILTISKRDERQPADVPTKWRKSQNPRLMI
jgi:hypothetical protein